MDFIFQRTKKIKKEVISKLSGRKKIMKIRAEINKIETTKAIEKNQQN